MQPAVHAASHWAMMPAGRMCLKCVFNPKCGKGQKTCGRIRAAAHPVLILTLSTKSQLHQTKHCRQYLATRRSCTRYQNYPYGDRKNSSHCGITLNRYFKHILPAGVVAQWLAVWTAGCTIPVRIPSRLKYLGRPYGVTGGLIKCS